MEARKMTRADSGFGTFVWRITAAHTIAYFIAGVFALAVLRYGDIFGSDSPLAFMRATDSPWVAAGAGLQVVRGLLLALVLCPFRSILFETPHGWVKFWTLSFGLSYLLTISAAPGSFEGYIYTDLPLRYHLIGVPEVVLYLTIFTALVYGWRGRLARTINVVSMVAVPLIILLSFMGILAALGIIDTA
jgi:hypothetical protein